VERQGHGRTADADRPMTIHALASDVIALLDQLGIAEADLFGFSLGGLVACAVALGVPSRVGKLIVASADAHHPPGRKASHSTTTACRRGRTSKRCAMPTNRSLPTQRISTSSRRRPRIWCTSSRAGLTSCDNFQCRPY